MNSQNKNGHAADALGKANGTSHDKMAAAWIEFMQLQVKIHQGEKDFERLAALQAILDEDPEFLGCHKIQRVGRTDEFDLICLHDTEDDAFAFWVEDSEDENPDEEVDPWAEMQGDFDDIGQVVSQDGKSPFGSIFSTIVEPDAKPDVQPEDEQPETVQPMPIHNEPELEGGYTLAALLATEFKQPEWVVPDILPVGLAAIGGRPKIGKSYMLVKLAAEASCKKGEFLGKTVGGQKVLYLALEDSPRRFKDRMNEWGATQNSNLEIHFKWPTGEKGLDKLKKAVASGFTFIIIDTISVFLGKKNQLKAEVMNVAFQRLHELTLDENNPVCILLVDHFPKRVSPETNPVDAMFGSTAKAAKLDVALGIYTERGKKNKLFKVQGRDLEDLEFNFAFEPKKGRLEIVGDNGWPEVTGVQEEILGVIHSIGSATNKEIADALERDKSNVHKELKELAKKGKVQVDDSSTPYVYTANG